jgi:hypothetical protein
MLERLQTIIRAYVVATFASGCALALCLGLIAVVGLLIEGRWRNAAISLALAPLFLAYLAGMATLFALVIAFVPTLVVIVLAEAVHARSAAFYGVAGTIVALVCAGYFFRRDGTWLWMPSAGMELTLNQALVPGLLVLVGCAAGLVGGLVYWRIAGMTAGGEP